MFNGIYNFIEAVMSFEIFSQFRRNIFTIRSSSSFFGLKNEKKMCCKKVSPWKSVTYDAGSLASIPDALAASQ